MRGLLTVLLICAGSSALAHPGHWAEAAGHNHWAAGIAIGLAGLAALLGARKAKKERDAAADAEPEEELEEEAA